MLLQDESVWQMFQSVELPGANGKISGLWFQGDYDVANFYSLTALKRYWRFQNGRFFVALFEGAPV
jgi:hypothetical protein